MQCPHCNQEHADNLRICPNTNLPLGRMITCQNCGRESRPGARYCAGCGQPLPRQTGRLNPSVLDEYHGNGAGTSASTPAEPAFEPSPSHTEFDPVLPLGAAPEPVSTPAAAPLALDSTAAWVAIPTSPRSQDTTSGKSGWSANIKYIGIGAILLVILIGLFFLFRSNQPPGTVITPQVAISQATSLPATQAPVVAPIMTATKTLPPASPTPEQPSTRPADTSLPPEITPTSQTSIAATEPADVAEKNRLVFLSNRDGGFSAFSIDPDHPSDWFQIPLPEDYEVINWPAFCGERIAYVAEDRSLGLPRQVFLYDPTSQEIQAMKFADPGINRPYSPRCSLDGKYMAVTVLHDGHWYLDVIELESGKTLYEQPAGGYPQFGFATWPSAADRFVWMGVKTNGFFDINQTSQLNMDSEPRTVLMAQGKYPAISPDGNRLAYFCGNLSSLCMVEWPSQKTLFKIPISYFKLINKKPAPATAAWSADGAWVYFSSSIAGNWDIYRMRPDGSQVQNLTEESTADELMPSAR